MKNNTSPMRPISSFISAHLIRRTSPVKTAWWRELRLNPPAYDPERSRRLVRRVTTPPIKKLPSLFIASGGHDFSSSGSPVSALESYATAHAPAAAAAHQPRTSCIPAARARRVLHAVTSRRTRAALRLDVSPSRERGYTSMVARRRMPSASNAPQGLSSPPSLPVASEDGHIFCCGLAFLSDAKLYSRRAPSSFWFPRHRRRHYAASHAHSTTTHILAPSPMSSADYLESTALEPRGSKDKKK
ncbi:hypothetical protein FB451DRAFT_1558736 [Mycena latifolia]|nr:hypothetical protein FB451DRAFT_1558736 [Mycena latifolia]